MTSVQFAEQLPVPPPLTLRQREPGCPVPLTPSQLRIWRAYEKPPKTLSFRVCATALRLNGPLEAECLARSLSVLLRRHEALRIRFATEGGISRQHVEVPSNRCIEIVDLSRLAPTEREAELERRTQAFQSEQVDLSEGPLFKAVVWKLAADDHVFFMAIDHMVADNASIDILNREAWGIYASLARRSAVELPDLTVQFADYALWQQQRYAAWRTAHDAYWFNHLTGASCIRAPVATEEAPAAGATHGMRRVPWGRVLCARLRHRAREGKLRMSHIALACYALVMSHWIGCGNLIVPVVSHGRHGRPELKNVVGFIAGELYVRVQILEDESVHSLVEQVSAELLVAQEYQDLGRIPDLLPECSAELGFNWQSLNAGRESSQSSVELDPRINRMPYMVKGALLPHTLAPFFYDAGSDICLIVHFRSDVLAPEAIDRFGHNLRFIGERFAMEPTARIGSLVRQLRPILK